MLAGEVGVLFGFLSHRVLGQYELALLDPTTKPRLLFVAPNIDAAVGKLEVDRREFLHWVALHEVTHAPPVRRRALAARATWPARCASSSPASTCPSTSAGR